MLFVCCQKDEFTKHLETGLIKYERARPVNESLIKGITLEKFAIFKTAEDSYSLVIKLNDNVISEELEKYHVTFEAILDDENRKLRDHNADHNKKSYSFKSELRVINKHNYLINTIETKMKYFESLDIWLFLFDDEVYKSIGSKRFRSRIWDYKYNSNEG